MKSVAVFDFHRGIDFAGLSLVAGRLDYDIAVACTRFEHRTVGRPKALGVPVLTLKPNAKMLARCVGAHIGDAGRGFGQRTNHGAARIACEGMDLHVDAVVGMCPEQTEVGGDGAWLLQAAHKATSNGSFGGAKVPARLAVAKALDGGHALNGVGKCARCHKEHQEERAFFAGAVVIGAVDTPQGVGVEAVVEVIIGENRHHALGRRAAVMLGYFLIGAIASAELVTNGGGKVKRGDGKVIVDTWRALIGLAVDDVASEVRAVGRAFVEQGTACIRIAVNEHSRNLEMLETAERSDVVV